MILRTLSRSVRAVVCVLALTAAVRAEPVQQAKGPTQIEPGNLLVLDVGGPQRWILMPTDGPEYHLYHVTQAGQEVRVTVHKLPIGGDNQPDDPDDPPPAPVTLADLVATWADEANDPPTRAKLAAVYQFTAQAIDGGTIKTVAQVKGFQAQADTLVLGSAAAKWTPFLQNVKAHLDAKVADDLPSYRAAWGEIVTGLSRGIDAATIDYWQRVNAATWRQP